MWEPPPPWAVRSCRHPIPYIGNPADPRYVGPVPRILVNRTCDGWRYTDRSPYLPRPSVELDSNEFESPFERHSKAGIRQVLQSELSSLPPVRSVDDPARHHQLAVAPVDLVDARQLAGDFIDCLR